MHISELDTPVMLVDLTVLEANIRRLQAELTAAGVNGRPHIQRWRRQWPLCRRGRCRRTGYHPTRPIGAGGCGAHRCRCSAASGGEIEERLRNCPQDLAAVRFSQTRQVILDVA